MIPELGPGERGYRVHRITNEAPCGMCVESEEERYEEVMSVPKSLVRLLADFGMSSRVN